MTTKYTLNGKDFIFHLFDDNGKISISLYSDYVNVPVDKSELKDLIDFIQEYIDNN